MIDLYVLQKRIIYHFKWSENDQKNSRKKNKKNP